MCVSFFAIDYVRSFFLYNLLGGSSWHGKESILNSFFPFECIKIPELRAKPAAFLGLGEKHSFCLFLTSERKFMGFDYLRGMRLLNQTLRQNLGWQLHCVLFCHLIDDSGLWHSGEQARTPI